MSSVRAADADPAVDHAPAPPGERAQLARRALVSAILLGVLADTVFRAPALGLNVAAWATGAGAALVALAWRRDGRLKPESALWLATAFVLAAGFVWRDAEMLLFFDVVGGLAALALLSMTLRGAPASGILEARLRDVGFAGLLVIGHAASRAPLLALRDSEPRILRHEATRGGLASAARALVFALPVLLVFTLLLAKADPFFGSLLTLPGVDLGKVASHVLMTGFFAWIVAGWMRGALLEAPRTTPGTDRRIFTLSAIDVTTTLGLLDLLFAAFVAVQIGWLFGGERLVRQTAALTYADYARSGFFELTLVAALAVPVLLVLRAAIPSADAGALRRYRVLATACLALLGAIIASAAARMELYVRFYGPSADRIYASAIMLWITLSLAALGATVLRERPRRFAAAVVGSALAVLAGLNAIDPAGLVARSHVARAASDPKLFDARYLSRLGADAVPSLVPALLAQPRLTEPAYAASPDAASSRCSAVARLLRQYGSRRYSGGESERERDDWRSWNGSRWRAVAIVERNEPSLRSLKCWNPKAGALEPFGTREFESGTF